MKPKVEVISEPYIEVPQLGLAIAKELSLGGADKNWWGCQWETLFHPEEGRMLTLYEFAKFLDFLKTSEDSENEGIYGKILKPKAYHFEAIDARFERASNGLYMYTDNQKFPDGTCPKEKIIDGLREHRFEGINLEEWTSNPTSQGLPRENIGKGNLRYHAPSDGSVAVFQSHNNRKIDLELCSYGGCHIGLRLAKPLR